MACVLPSPHPITIKVNRNFVIMVFLSAFVFFISSCIYFIVGHQSPLSFVGVQMPFTF